MLNEFAFDKSTQNYRIIAGSGKGQFISRVAINSLINTYRQQEKDLLKNLTNEFTSGKLNIAEWEMGVTSILKTSAINLYKLNNPDLTVKDLGIIGAKLRGQYRSLRKVSMAVIKGELTAGQLQVRISNLYNKTTTEIVELSKQNSHSASGFRWEKRMLSIAKHCNDCLVYADLGWQIIGSLPNPSESCACNAGCKCYKIYSKATIKPI
jgi:hypothetical protein